MKKLYLLTTLLVFTLLLSGCQLTTRVDNEADDISDQQNTGLANPASVNCEDKGGTLRMEQDENGTYGICVLPDGTECEEWEYYRGECGSNTSANAQITDSTTGDEKTAVGNDKIKIFGIQSGDNIVSPATISGEAAAFENNLIIELRNSERVALVKEFTTIKSAEAGKTGPFSITINFDFNNTKEGYLAVYEQSAHDGSELNLVEIPVEFGEIDTSNWQIYRNEEYGFEFKYDEAWAAPKLMKQNDRVYINFGPVVNREGTEGISYHLTIYFDKNSPIYYSVNEDCSPVEESKVCVKFDNQYGDIVHTEINGYKAYVSKIGDMATQYEVFIEGKNNGYLFSGSEYEKKFIAVLQSFNE
ncbi:MAG: DUF333 domain-containing protein [Patescibacteria group bacterium]